MSRSAFPLIVATCLLVAIGTAQATTRTDAVELLSQLRQNTSSNRFSDELRSLDATLATAEMYYQLNDQKNADRYYQLAIQKGRLIQQQLVELTTMVRRSNTSTPLTDTSPFAAPSSSHSFKNVIQQPTSSTTSPSKPIAQPILQMAPDTDQLETYSSIRLVGTVGSYTVAKGDTIRLVAAKLGVSRANLAAMNGLSMKEGLKIGSLLRYNNRRIIPEHKIKDGIVINIPDRMLYLFQQGTMTFSTAVALGTPTKTDQFVWETPIGKFKIVNKAKDPTWTVPPSIQEEMRLEGKEVITSIPPGKNNPLGKYAIKTSLPGILIHSTTKPWSIYTYASHGCIRVYPERMEELFKLVKVQSSGEIIYRPIKLAITEDGRILLEAHGDIYNKSKGLATEAKNLIRARKLDDKVDWEKVKKVISHRTGVAEEITRVSAEAQKDATRLAQSPS
jgi:L,D-transpeptidase ErfK/SrfK